MKERTMKKILISCIFFLPIHASWFGFFSDQEQKSQPSKPSFTVMIDPAGDAQTPGRTIDDTFERSLSLHCAEELKRLLESGSIPIKVILTRSAGETIEPMQRISFANRLNVNLYLTIHLFEKKQAPPQLFFYTMLYDPQTDIMVKKKDELELLPFDQAYRINIANSQNYCLQLYQFIEKKVTPKQLGCNAPIAFPYKPLIGITAPAIGIELGIAEKDQWQKIIPILAEAIQEVAR